GPRAGPWPGPATQPGTWVSVRVRRRGRAVLAGLHLGVRAERVEVQPARLRVRRDGAVLAHVRDVVRVLIPDAARRDPALLRVLVDRDRVRVRPVTAGVRHDDDVRG